MWLAAVSSGVLCCELLPLLRGEMAGRNPFTMPSDEEVFALRDEEKLRKEQVRASPPL